MRYCGMDVHATSTVWCVLDEQGEVVSGGRIATTTAALEGLVQELRAAGELLVGQEVGTMTYLARDAVTAAGATILSFNAQQLRMIAASRKKTDRRDAYWLAKALLAGMCPHPVYIPPGHPETIEHLESHAVGHDLPQDLALRFTRDVAGEAHDSAVTTNRYPVEVGILVGAKPLAHGLRKLLVVEVAIVVGYAAVRARPERAGRRLRRRLEGRLAVDAVPGLRGRLETLDGHGLAAPLAETVDACGDLRARGRSPRVRAGHAPGRDRGAAPRPPPAPALRFRPRGPLR